MPTDNMTQLDALFDKASQLLPSAIANADDSKADRNHIIYELQKLIAKADAVYETKART